ncbi:MAG: transcription termination factor NusA [Oscillospiraceae bacterium]|nr:transcription termination factor NusA [Oscillospiraceae bacterium]
MNAEFFDAILMIEKEKGIPREYMHEKIAQALTTAYRRDNAGVTDNLAVELDEKKKEIHMYVKKDVVETVENTAMEMTPEEARAISPGAAVGDTISIEIPMSSFGRIAAQTAKQVIIQGIREAERGMIFQEFTSKENEILPALVTRVDQRNGNLILELGSGNDKTEVVLTAGEQARGEFIREGDRVRIYVVEVRKSPRGPQILISRTHPGLVKRLFELEVPEIAEGLVEIRSIAREAGNRTKLAVWSSDENVDPRGACIGPKSQRVNSVVAELRGEKIDVVLFSEDPEEYIAQALAPATVLEVRLAAEGKSCRVIVPDDQLSLAIGREGQNARLAAKLTGYKIDIKPESFVEEET